MSSTRSDVQCSGPATPTRPHKTCWRIAEAECGPAIRLDRTSISAKPTATLIRNRRKNTHSARHRVVAVSYTHLRAHETVLDLVCRLLLEKKKKKKKKHKK